ncbi:recombination regulator RecX [Streptococcus macacae]|uniref:Regulatory protein RecX n=1 Tax=Streptococcus macacae NCTC 11558 TaxID=764298 RepID=G5JWS7_9STRE|nr:recombination regulator RecX [Streptococcus macacae]EHJ52681.1 regulatory protein RecX [Streptococcus macacae NCTC 11558]SUN79035.1 recombination regulator RecX [Streptococcus macacae NCTC 11558]
MKITKIEKKKRLYLVEIDHHNKLYVTEDTIVRFMLSRDKEILPEELEGIKAFAQFSYGKNLALYYLSFKQRTEKEIKDYLIKHDIKTAVIFQILTQLKEEKWLDDSKYIENILQQNLHCGDKGAYVLKQKLLRKGIEAQLIESALKNFDFTSICLKAAQKLLKKYQKKLPQRALEDKIKQALLTKGFSHQEVQIALAELDIENDSENEKELLYKELDKQYRKYQKKYEGYELKRHLTQSLARKGFDYHDIKNSLREYL